MTPGRKGFTLIELLIVVLIVGTLTGLAIPHMNRAILRARAVDVIATLDVIDVALSNYQAEESAWPADVNRGVIPAGLEPYLPEGFSFERDEYTIDYEDWSGGVGFIGLSVITDDSDLGLMILELLGNNAWTNGMDRYTWVLEWTS